MIVHVIKSSIIYTLLYILKSWDLVAGHNTKLIHDPIHSLRNKISSNLYVFPRTDFSDSQRPKYSSTYCLPPLCSSKPLWNRETLYSRVKRQTSETRKFHFEIVQRYVGCLWLNVEIARKKAGFMGQRATFLRSRY